MSVAFTVNIQFSGFVYRRKYASPGLYEFARLMQDPVKPCDSGCCVEIKLGGGVTEKRLLEIDQGVPSPENACKVYQCRV